jgi:hypothetical protein
MSNECRVASGKSANWELSTGNWELWNTTMRFLPPTPPMRGNAGAVTTITTIEGKSGGRTTSFSGKW